MSDSIQCERVKDGIVLTNLKPGIYEIRGEFYLDFMCMSEGGGLWPYKAVVIGASYPNNTYLIRIEEIP